MRAFLMRGAVLEVLDDRLEGHRLQAERGEKQERQGPSPFWGKWESSRVHDDPQSENFPTMTFWSGCTVRYYRLPGGQDHEQVKKTDENGTTQGPCDFVRLTAGCNRSGDQFKARPDPPPGLEEVAARTKAI